MVIKICTESKNTERVRDLCAKRFDAFTIYHGMGAWKGQLEPSMTIEIAVLAGNDALYCETQAQQLALEIKKLNKQEAVLIEYLESKNELI